MWKYISPSLAGFFSLFLLSLLLPHNLFAKEKETISQDSHTIRLATTTSTENSGLLDYLLPDFEKSTGYQIHVIAVGTGKALRMGKDGDVDVLLVHAPKAEKAFITAGYGTDRTAIMHNDFVIVGPPADPADIAHATSAPDAMLRLYKTKSRFISRGDNSGTHKKERSLWKLANQNPTDKWYIEAGQGMGKVLLMASELDAYTLTDRGTWLAYRDKSPLNILYQGDETLHNPYSAIAVNPERYQDINYQGALAFIHYLATPAIQKRIAAFRLYDQPLFIPDAMQTQNNPAETTLSARKAAAKHTTEPALLPSTINN